MDLSGNYFCSITPQSTDSNILTQFRIKYTSSYGQNDRLTINVKRSISSGLSTTIASDTVLGPLIATTANNDLYMLNYIDSPATTSSVKYYLTYQLESTGGGVPTNTVGIVQSKGNNIVLQELLGSGTANQGSMGPTGSIGPTGPSTLSITSTNTNSTYYPTFVVSTGIGQTGYIDNDMIYNPSTNTLTATNFSGTATMATNVAGGLGGQIPYQSAVNTTALLANGTAGQLLTSQGTTLAPIWSTISTFNTLTFTFASLTSVDGVSPSFALTPVGVGLTASIWQCTFVGENGENNLIVNATFSFVGGQMKGVSNISGDYSSPTKFYGVPASSLLYFSCGDFGTLLNCRFSFTRIF